MIMGDNGKYIEQFLELPQSPPEGSLAVVSSVTHAAMNKEIEKQDAMATFQLLEKYYQSMMMLAQTAMQSGGSIIAEMVPKIAKAAADKVKQVLETYGEMSPEPYTDIFPEGFNGSQPPTPATGGIPQPPGMGGIQGPPQGEAGNPGNQPMPPPPDLGGGF
jgi:hypothetical protein